VLTAIAAAVREEKDRLARVETLENGKPLSEAREQVERAARHFEYYAGIADKIQGEHIPLGESYVDYTIREPLGVTAHIVPWNVPIYLFARSVAPALAAGNAAVVKPAEETPLGALELAALASEAGLPSGLLNVVPGYGHEAGAALTGHPDVVNSFSQAVAYDALAGDETPFGGYKDSGIGRENGVQAIGNCTQVKNVCANIDLR
jgi:aldehyde dehydrogenase (NAD+)